MIGGRSDHVRHPAVAGSFYPRDADVLNRTVNELLNAAKCKQQAGIRAIIVPHAGYVYSGPVAAEAFTALGTLGSHVKRVVLIGPSHFVRFRGIAVPHAGAFRTPLGELPLDGEAIRDIVGLPQIVVEDGPHAGEHALEVELPFVQAIFGAIPIVPLVVGAATADEVAEVLERLWEDETLIVVSSDLSHYHDYETARRLDTATAEAIERLDEAAIGFDDACGSLAVRGLLIAARHRGFAVERVDLRNSGDTAGDRNRVVGYGAWSIRRV